MRSKSVAKEKKTAPSAPQSQTTPKKRGRPSKADIAAREAGISPMAVKAPAAAPVEKTEKKAVAAKAPKLPKAAKAKKQTAWDVTFDKISLLAAMGALHIKVDGIEVAFAPEAFARVTQEHGRSYNEADYDADRESDGNVRALAKVAPMDNPDEYAEAQDRWATHEPLPRI